MSNQDTPDRAAPSLQGELCQRHRSSTTNAEGSVLRLPGILRRYTLKRTTIAATMAAAIICIQLSPLGAAETGLAFIRALSGTAAFAAEPQQPTSDNRIREIKHGSNVIGGLAFSPDGRALVSAGFDKRLKLWSVENGSALATITGHTALVFCVAYSADGRLIASGSADKTLRLWDAQTGAAVAVLNGHTAPIRSVAFSPDGRLVASAGLDNSVRIWDITRKLLAGSAMRLMSAMGSPSTSNRSARAPCSTTPSLPA